MGQAITTLMNSATLPLSSSLKINMTRTFRIATRQSPLALWQAQHIREQLLVHWPMLSIELLPMKTSGDRFLQAPLRTAGGKGLFVKELEEALLDGRADLAVHSMKDVPVFFPDGLGLAAICQRDNPFDAFISPRFSSVDDLPLGAKIGTASLRRQSQLLAYRPDLIVRPLRGNIQTRLQHLEQQAFDGIILAEAGLTRMNLQAFIRETLSEQLMLPACGQGALGLECRLSDHEMLDYIAPLNDPRSALCVHTERHVNAQLGGNCHTPIAIYCTLTTPTQLYLRARVLSPDGQLSYQVERRGAPENAMLLAQECAQQLLQDGDGCWLMSP